MTPPIFPPDPDSSCELRPSAARRCVICAVMILAGATCPEHALIEVMRSLVRTGFTSDWIAYVTTPNAAVLPTHDVLMTVPPSRRQTDWRAQLASLLAFHGFWLEDGEGSE